MFLIKNYTYESGACKLKIIIYYTLGINIRLVNKEISIPFKIKNDDIKSDYLKEKNSVIPYKIKDNIKQIYGLWANNYGMGGCSSYKYKIISIKIHIRNEVYWIAWNSNERKCAGITIYSMELFNR